MAPIGKPLLALGSAAAVAVASASLHFYTEKENQDVPASSLEEDMKNLSDLAYHVVYEAKELAEMTEKVKKKVESYNFKDAEMAVKESAEDVEMAVKESAEDAVMAFKEGAKDVEMALKESAKDAEMAQKESA